jgi:hypothetical protein
VRVAAHQRLVGNTGDQFFRLAWSVHHSGAGHRPFHLP